MFVGVSVKELYKVFHESNINDFELELSKRQSFPTTSKLKLTIKPIHQPNRYDLYYIPTNKMLDLVSEIYKYSRKIINSYDLLPNIAMKV